MFFVDKYRIKNKEDVMFNQDIYNDILNIEKKNINKLPNLFFHGQSGCGKHNIIEMFLKNFYGDDIYDIYQTYYEYNSTKSKENKLIQINNIEKSKLKVVKFIENKYFLRINPYGTSVDRHIFQIVISDFFSKQNFEFLNTEKKIKFIIIDNVDKLNIVAQSALRRKMEKYVNDCKFILCGNETNKIIDPIKSRCLLIRVPSPNLKNMNFIATKILKSEKIKISKKELNNLVSYSDKSIKKLLWNIQFYTEKISFKLNWKNSLKRVARFILLTKISEYREYDVKLLRSMLYKIYVSNVNKSDIFNTLVDHMITILNEIPSKNDDQEKNIYKIIQLAAKYENNVANSGRVILSIESFIYKIISEIKIV